MYGNVGQPHHPPVPPRRERLTEPSQLPSVPPVPPRLRQTDKAPQVRPHPFIKKLSLLFSFKAFYKKEARWSREKGIFFKDLQWMSIKITLCSILDSSYDRK